MKSTILVLFVLILFSCSEDEQPIETVFNEVERGAVLRNITYFNTDFEVGNPESAFRIEVEELDIEEGALIDEVDLLLQFVDRTPSGGDLSTTEFYVKSIPKNDFVIGPDGYLRTIINLTFAEVLTASGLSIDQVDCNDQFIVRLNLKLTDGRDFSTVDANAAILTDGCFYKSPYRYMINVVAPIDENLFTGTYLIQYLDQDGGIDPDAGTQLVTITNGYGTNTRQFAFADEPMEFAIACDATYVNLYQKYNGRCDLSNSVTLFGPDTQGGVSNNDDDSVFTLRFVIGYEGWLGGASGEGDEIPVHMRLSRQ